MSGNENFREFTGMQDIKKNTEEMSLGMENIVFHTMLKSQHNLIIDQAKTIRKLQIWNWILTSWIVIQAVLLFLKK